jgi:glycoside/pentoside/hexuronide:cation symporter, GPH family
MTLPASVRHGYGVAAVSLSFCNTTILFFLAKFLLDEAGLSPGQAAVVITVAKVWDAVSDPIVGRLSDRTNTSMGARRPWILGATLPCMGLFALLWVGLPFHGVALVAAYTAILMLFNTAYTAVVVPYGALTPALTTDYDERTRLNGARMLWSMVGGIIASIVVPMAHEVTGTYATGAWALAVVGIVPLLIAVWATAGRDRSSFGTAPPVSMWSVLKVRAFRRTALLFLAAWSSIAVLGSLVPFYAQIRLGRPDLVVAMLAAIQISAMVSIPLVIRLAAVAEKHTAYAVSVVAWAFVLLGLALVPPGAIWAVMLVAVLAGPGVAAAHVLPWSMLPDVVEADRAVHGVERAGAFYGVMTFLEKIGTAIAWNAMLLALDAAGYVSGAAEQPESVETAIQWLIGPIPGMVLLMAAFYAYRFPPLTREEHRALVHA